MVNVEHFGTGGVEQLENKCWKRERGRKMVLDFVEKGSTSWNLNESLIILDTFG